MNDDLETRLRRLYAAIGETQETNLSRFPAQVTENDKGFLIHQDFLGGRTDEQLTNTLQSLIALIAGLEYHLYKWASKNGHGIDRVKLPLQASQQFSIVHDLWNTEKHGYSPNRGSDRTGMAPQLVNVTRVMRLAAQTTQTFVLFRVGEDGKPVISGDGTADFIITGDVVAKDGKLLGHAHEILESAVKDCEQLLHDLGVS